MARDQIVGQSRKAKMKIQGVKHPFLKPFLHSIKIYRAKYWAGNQTCFLSGCPPGPFVWRGYLIPEWTSLDKDRTRKRQRVSASVKQIYEPFGTTRRFISRSYIRSFRSRPGVWASHGRRRVSYELRNRLRTGDGSFQKQTCWV